MDLSRRLRTPFWRVAHSSRILQLSSGDLLGSGKQLFKKVSPSLVRRARASCLILGAIALGSLAHQKARTEALSEWENMHQPSPPVWEHALGSRGFIRIKEGKLMKKALKSVPIATSLEAAQTLWITPSLNWVSLPSGEIFCAGLPCETAPSQWQPMHSSWASFDHVIAQIDAKPRAKPAKPRRKEPSDPREIRY